MYKMIIAAFAAFSLVGCATATEGGLVLKSETQANFLGGELSIGNTIYNISGENSAGILREMHTRTVISQN